MHSVIMEEHLTVTLVDVLLDLTVHVVDFVRIDNYNLFCVILSLNFL